MANRDEIINERIKEGACVVIVDWSKVSEGSKLPGFVEQLRPQAKETRGPCGKPCPPPGCGKAYIIWGGQGDCDDGQCMGEVWCEDNDTSTPDCCKCVPC